MESGTFVQEVVIRKYQERSKRAPRFILLQRFDIHNTCFEGCVKLCQGGGLALRLFSTDRNDKLPKWKVSVVNASGKDILSEEKVLSIDLLTSTPNESEWTETNSIPLSRHLFLKDDEELIDEVELKWTVSTNNKATEEVIDCVVSVSTSSDLRDNSSVHTTEHEETPMCQDEPSESEEITLKGDTCCQEMVINNFPKKCRKPPHYIIFPEFNIQTGGPCKFQGCLKVCQDGDLALRLDCMDGTETFPCEVKWRVTLHLTSGTNELPPKTTIPGHQLTSSLLESEWDDNNIVTLSKVFFRHEDYEPVDSIGIQWSIEVENNKVASLTSKVSVTIFPNRHGEKSAESAMLPVTPDEDIQRPPNKKEGQISSVETTSMMDTSSQEVVINNFPKKCRKCPHYIIFPKFTLQTTGSCTYYGCLKVCQDGSQALRLDCMDGNKTFPWSIEIKWHVVLQGLLGAKQIPPKTTIPGHELTPSYLESEWNENNSVTLSKEFFRYEDSRLVDGIAIKWDVEVTLVDKGNRTASLKSAVTMTVFSDRLREALAETEVLPVQPEEDNQEPQSLGGAEEDNQEPQSLRGAEGDNQDSQSLGGAEEDNQEPQSLRGAEGDHQEPQSLRGAEEDNQDSQSLRGAEEDNQEPQSLRGAEKDNQDSQSLRGAEEDNQEPQSLRGAEGDNQDSQSLGGAEEDNQEPQSLKGAEGDHQEPQSLREKLNAVIRREREKHTAEIMALKAEIDRKNQENEKLQNQIDIEMLKPKSSVHEANLQFFKILETTQTLTITKGQKDERYRLPLNDPQKFNEQEEMIVMYTEDEKKTQELQRILRQMIIFLKIYQKEPAQRDEEMDKLKSEISRVKTENQVLAAELKELKVQIDKKDELLAEKKAEMRKIKKKYKQKEGECKGYEAFISDFWKQLKDRASEAAQQSTITDAILKNKMKKVFLWPYGLTPKDD